MHVAGTNGKTSTARMIDALLREFGLRTGRFTSPHLHSMASGSRSTASRSSAERFVATYDDVAPYVHLVDSGTRSLSFFEVLTAMAFAAFADAPVDVAVVEVGLGGTWDATNVADAQVAVITPIGLDHTEFLGLDHRADRRREGRDLQAGLDRACWPTAAGRGCEVLLRRSVEVDALVAREGLEFGVLEHHVAVGGQRCGCGAWPGSTTTCSCRCWAPTRPTTPPARSRRSRRSWAGRGHRPAGP